MNNQYISSKDNSQYKQLKKLSGSARERRKCGQTLIDGVHLVNALADSGALPETLFIREGSESNDEIKHCLTRFPQTNTITLEQKLFDTISPVETPVGLLALITIPHARKVKPVSAVLLENIQDPGNLGSILRTAAAAGINAVFLSKGCAEAWSPKALRAGMGAQFVIDINEQSELETVCRNFSTILATSLDASQSLYDVNLTGSVAFIFGNEGAGLSEDLLQKATHKINIPMPGKVESLNVAAAVSACLFERVRQRSKSP